MSILDDSDVIFSYTRAQALCDGELVDVSEWASSSKGFLGGFTVPVAFTSALWSVVEDLPRGSGEDVRGRAHDVLFMASIAIRRSKNHSVDSAEFSVLVSRSKGRVTEKLLVHIGPGDIGEPVVTIGFPEDF